MPLAVSYVERLADVLEHAAAFLDRPGDLFVRPRIVVPLPGAKAWLLDGLARRLGATGRDDGIVAGVEITYPGSIVALLRPVREAASDPWSFERLTYRVLEVITGPEAAGLGIPFDVAAEPLLTARRIAGLFDEYHMRRPAMILLWEKDRPAFSPVATPRDPEGSGGELPEADRWQFRTWQAVRRRIGCPSPPAVVAAARPELCAPLLVVGLQTLSLEQIAALKRLGESGDVRALVVHPSPTLAARWSASLPAESPGVPPKREPAELPDDLDPLVASWLHGARETQVLLASQGLRPRHEGRGTDAAAHERPSLLARMQRSIASARRPEAEPHDLESDRSIVIHRCHSLARQAEVLCDAILHAFHELPGLAPHDVAIVSPCLERLAPHLAAVFDRTIEAADGTTVRLPLVIADRSLHEVSDAAELLLDLMALVGSRCSVEQFLAVTTHPLVMGHFRVADDASAAWEQLVERTSIHWGFDAAHRLRAGFPPEAAEPHTWRAGLERMLLGAVLPDAEARPELGGAVPLSDVALADLPAVATLVRIFDVVLALDAATAEPRPTAAWCNAIEEALFGLCGESASELAEPLGVVRALRDSAGDTPVPFADVREVLAESLRATAGRQPLRTGAITATSMVPLRDVPFRVICVAGYDDGAVAAGEPRGDDLVARQQLAGDGDPRIEVRRALLDSLLAARDRLVVTCNGSDIKNNQPLPLVTPLAELVDFAVRHGVALPEPASGSGIEVTHPRHALSRKNFAAGAVQPGVTWSHDEVALDVARAVGHAEQAVVSVAGPPPDLPVIELATLEWMVRDPLGLYLKHALGVDTWRDDEGFPAATFPLTLEARDERALTRELLDVFVTKEGDEAARVAAWRTAVRGSGRVPFGHFGDAALRGIEELARGIRDGARTEKKGPVPLTGFETIPVRMPLGGRLLTGHASGFHRPTNQLVDVRTTKGTKAAWGLPLHVAALRLLVCHAAGTPADQAVVVARHEKWKPGQGGPVMIARRVTLAPALASREAATERLARIADLLPLALVAPCGRFDGTWTKLDDDESARTTFASALRDDDYGDSNEAIVYGSHPRFDEVFAPGSPERRFHTEFSALLTLADRKYVLS
jgi:exodeoxyribonuclease V gamma subunit